MAKNGVSQKKRQCVRVSIRRRVNRLPQAEGLSDLRGTGDQQESHHLSPKGRQRTCPSRDANLLDDVKHGYRSDAETEVARRHKNRPEKPGRLPPAVKVDAQGCRCCPGRGNVAARHAGGREHERDDREDCIFF